MNPPHQKAAATLPLVRWAIYSSMADRKVYDINLTPGEGWQGKHGRLPRAARASNRVRIPAP